MKIWEKWQRNWASWKKTPIFKRGTESSPFTKDPDDKNVMVEIRAGAGGDEASIFVADVFRMYQNYLRDLGFKNEVISLSEGDEGIKEVIFSVKGKVYSKLKYESGVHRVQESRKLNLGRVHTSTITVAIMPEVDDVEFDLDMTEVE